MPSLEKVLQHVLLGSFLIGVALMAHSISPQVLRTDVLENETSTGSVVESSFPEIHRVSRIEPPMSYPGGEVTFQMYVYDEDGFDDIETVRVNLFPFEGPRIFLNRKETDEGGVWFERAVTVPTTTRPGTYTFEILATDSQGKSGFAKRSVNIVRTREQVQLDLRKAMITSVYTEPKELNIGVTKDLYIYAEVQDEDGVSDISVVKADLSGIGREQTISMQKVKDIDRFTALYGYRVKDAEYIAPLGNTMEVNVEALDLSNKGTKKVLSLELQREVQEAEALNSPEEATREENVEGSNVHIVSTVVEENVIEMYLDKPLHVPSFKSSGQDIHIAPEGEMHKYLPISKAVLGRNGSVIRVFTNNIEDGVTYAVWLEDGVAFQDGTRSMTSERALFRYDKAMLARPLLFTSAKLVDNRTITVEATKDIEFSSLAPETSACAIYSQNNTKVTIEQIHFASGNTLQLSLAEPITKGRYRLECSGIRGAGSKIAGRITQSFDARIERHPSDLTGDGVVNFMDFTLFVQDYDTTTTTK